MRNNMALPVSRALVIMLYKEGKIMTFWRSTNNVDIVSYIYQGTVPYGYWSWRFYIFISDKT